jgi:hypothetical protein
VVTVVVTPASASVEAGATVQFTATARDGAGSTIPDVSFTWSAANAAVATVDANGLATGVVMGTTTIQAMASGIAGTGDITVVPNNNPDAPDDLFLDSNGDGIDGDIAAAVFVSTTGSDANPGTPTEPKQTLAAAIAAAVADAEKTEVYVSSGTYSETVELADGINIYGGYDAASDWDRTATNVATIQGDTTAVIGQSITTSTTVDRTWRIRTPSSCATLRSPPGTVGTGRQAAQARQACSA